MTQIPDEGMCLEPMAKGSSIRCSLPYGHDEGVPERLRLHCDEDLRVSWGRLVKVSDPDETVEP